MTIPSHSTRIPASGASVTAAVGGIGKGKWFPTAPSPSRVPRSSPPSGPRPGVIGAGTPAESRLQQAQRERRAANELTFDLADAKEFLAGPGLPSNAAFDRQLRRALGDLKNTPIAELLVGKTLADAEALVEKVKSDAKPERVRARLLDTDPAGSAVTMEPSAKAVKTLLMQAGRPAQDLSGILAALPDGDAELPTKFAHALKALSLSELTGLKAELERSGRAMLEKDGSAKLDAASLQKLGQLQDAIKTALVRADVSRLSSDEVWQRLSGPPAAEDPGASAAGAGIPADAPVGGADPAPEEAIQDSAFALLASLYAFGRSGGEDTLLNLVSRLGSIRTLDRDMVKNELAGLIQTRTIDLRYALLQAMTGIKPSHDFSMDKNVQSGIAEIVNFLRDTLEAAVERDIAKLKNHTDDLLEHVAQMPYPSVNKQDQINIQQDVAALNKARSENIEAMLVEHMEDKLKSKLLSELEEILKRLTQCNTGGDGLGSTLLEALRVCLKVEIKARKSEASAKADPSKIPQMLTTLGLNDHSTSSDVKTRYLKLMLTLHPDKVPMDTESTEREKIAARHREVTEAYELLMKFQERLPVARAGGDPQGNIPPDDPGQPPESSESMLPIEHHQTPGPAAGIFVPDETMELLRKNFMNASVPTGIPFGLGQLGEDPAAPLVVPALAPADGALAEVITWPAI